MNRRLSVLALTTVGAFAVVLAGAWLQGTDSPSTIRQAQPEAAIAVDQRAPDRLPIQLPNEPRPSLEPAAQAGPSVTPSQAARYAKYLQADDLRTLVEAMKRSTAPGAGLYVSKAVFECSLFREIFGNPESLARMRAAAMQDSTNSGALRGSTLDQLERRCASFSSAELGLDDEKFLREWGAGRDPYLMLKLSLHQSTTERSVLSKRIQAVLDTQEPGLLALLPGASFFPSDGGTAPAAYLDGKPFGGLDFESYVHAWRLANCEYAGTCEMRDADVMLECALDGKCYGGISASTYGKLTSSEQRRDVDAVAARLLEVLRTRNGEALAPPP